MIAFIRQLLSSLTVLGLVIMLLFFAACLLARILRKDLWQSRVLRDLTSLMQRYGLWFAFVVAVLAMSGSLFFSDVVGWEPCRLCWYQRIAIYPAVVLLGVAIYRDDRSVTKYLYPLIFIGGAIALYQYSMQQFPALIAETCALTGGTSCTTAPERAFGIITIPLMSLTSCLLMWMFSGFATLQPRSWWKFWAH